MLSCPPRELPRDRCCWEANRSHLSWYFQLQGQSSPFPWDRSIAAGEETERSAGCAQPGSTALWWGIVPGACRERAPACNTHIEGDTGHSPAPACKSGGVFSFVYKRRALLGSGSGYISPALCAGQQQPGFPGLMSKRGPPHLIVFAQTLSRRSVLSRDRTE